LKKWNNQLDKQF